nr:IS66-like element accessory protein TnpA [Shigella boydii]
MGIFCTIHTLRLHFEEHLPLVVAGRRLGVPKSTVCSMFVRFRKAGLSWPLPAGMSERELDARLYGSASTVPVVLTESTVMPEVPGVKKRPRRPNFPYEFKIALVEQSLQPGACVAQIARENGINDNLLFNWRHQYRKGGLLPSGKNMPALLPVTLTPEPDNHGFDTIYMLSTHHQRFTFVRLFDPYLIGSRPTFSHLAHHHIS